MRVGPVFLIELSAETLTSVGVTVSVRLNGYGEFEPGILLVGSQLRLKVWVAVVGAALGAGAADVVVPGEATAASSSSLPPMSAKAAPPITSRRTAPMTASAAGFL